MILKQFFRGTSLALVGTAILLSSCNSGSQNAQQGATADSLQKDSLTQQIKDVVYPLPTPFEMANMLNNIGAVYVPKALNPVSKADKYFTEKAKIVNLGVYGADLAYVVTYNKPQDIKLYMKALKQIMDQVGVKIDYSYMVSEEFKQKLSNKDTVVKIITTTVFDTYKYLNDKNSPEMAVMMASGMWIELMYIATHISNDTYDNPAIAKIIFDQKTSYNKLMALISEKDKNADIRSIEDKLILLKPVYEKAENGLTKEDYKLILKTIEEVRTSLVE
jgi:hypothetical protein